MISRARRRGAYARRIAIASAGSGLATAGVCSAYLAGLTVLALRAIARGAATTNVSGDPTTRFVVLVPAHNEEKLIESTVAGLLASEYPAELLRVHVVADNCTDDTAERAAHAGAVVHEHHAPGGKGAAVQWVLGQIRDSYDAAVIVDADTVVDVRALRVIDARLAQGAEVVQAYYAVHDPETSAATALRAAALALRHYLRPLARTSVGGSSGLFGNGMAFRSTVLEGRAWTSHLTEDIEFQLELLLDGRRIDFAPDAVVRAEMPANLAAATSQNERWERGRIQLLRRYVLPLLRPGPGRMVRADAAMDLALPPFSVLATLTSASTILGLAAGSRQGRWLRVGTVCVGVQAGHLLFGLVATKAPWAVYRSLLHAPALIAWKVRLWLRVLVRPSSAEWVRTARNAEQFALRGGVT